jgi:hypothetical protein
LLTELQERHGSSFQVPDLPDIPPPAKPKWGATPSYFRAMVFFDADWEADLEYFNATHDKGALAPVLAHLRAGQTSHQASARTADPRPGG